MALLSPHGNRVVAIANTSAKPSTQVDGQCQVKIRLRMRRIKVIYLWVTIPFDQKRQVVFLCSSHNLIAAASSGFLYKS